MNRNLARLKIGCPEGAALSRRRLLQAGSLGLMGVTLPRLLRADQENRSAGLTPRADACIIIFPQRRPQPSRHVGHEAGCARGHSRRVQADRHAAAGLSSFASTCRGWPAQMHRATVVRSMHHSVNNAHAAAVYCGADRPRSGRATWRRHRARPTNPAIGSVMALLRPPSAADRAERVAAVHHQGRGQRAAATRVLRRLLGRRYDPLFVLQDPNAADFAVPELTLLAGVTDARLSGRRNLLSAVGRIRFGELSDNDGGRRA